jgi:hypothetical protein
LAQPLERAEDNRVEDRRQLLFKNLLFGAVLGAGIGMLQVVSTQTTTTNAILLGHVIGGALGGAVLVLLASTILRWLFK